MTEQGLQQQLVQGGGAWLLWARLQQQSAGDAANRGVQQAAAAMQQQLVQGGSGSLLKLM
jgi:hypothetical protein